MAVRNINFLSALCRIWTIVIHIYIYIYIVIHVVRYKYAQSLVNIYFIGILRHIRTLNNMKRDKNKYIMLLPYPVILPLLQIFKSLLHSIYICSNTTFLVSLLNLNPIRYKG